MKSSSLRDTKEPFALGFGGNVGFGPILQVYLASHIIVQCSFSASPTLLITEKPGTHLNMQPDVLGRVRDGCNKAQVLLARAQRLQPAGQGRQSVSIACTTCCMHVACLYAAECIIEGWMEASRLAEPVKMGQQ